MVCTTSFITIQIVQILVLDDQDKHDTDRDPPLTELLPYGNVEPELSIPDEDIQAGITDDVLAQVRFPAKRSRESTSIYDLINYFRY